MSQNFLEYKEKSGDKTSVWHYFLRDASSQSAKCKTCSKILQARGGSTKGLRAHLIAIHNINLQKGQEASEVQENVVRPPEKKPNLTQITDFYSPENDKSLQAIISRLTALDGLPFSVFCTSSDLRDLLKAKTNVPIPTDPKTIRKIVAKHSEKIRSVVIAEMYELKQQGKKFSLTFDEWTSLRNRRYMVVNVHAFACGKQKFWNIGLIRVAGSMPAEACLQLLEEKLAKHKLSLYEDIVCICTDGARVMQKVGRLLKGKTNQQLCLAHGIQLAVVSVLYNKQQRADPGGAAEEEQEDEQESEDEQGTDDDGMAITFEEDAEDSYELQFDFGPLIKKVRQVVKLFRRSPTKNDAVLQKYVKEDFGRELSLIMDSKTRWNSLLAMIERFLQLQGPICKALVDLKSDIVFCEADFKHISEIVSALQPVKVAVEELCCRDSNLLTTDTILQFMLDKLDKQETSLAGELRDALVTRVNERRTELSGVLQYLHSASSVNARTTKVTTSKARPTSAEVSWVPDVTIIRKAIKTQVQQLQLQEKENDIEIPEGVKEVEEVSVAATASCSSKKRSSTCMEMKTELREKIRRTLEEPSAATCSSKSYGGTKETLTSLIRKETSLWEGGGDRGHYLQLVYEALLAIPPTSVEAERAFSAAGTFCTKLRSRLGDNSLDILCFLRSYYQKKRSACF